MVTRIRGDQNGSTKRIKKRMRGKYQEAKISITWK